MGLALVALLAACGSSYYSQAVLGQVRILAGRRSLEELAGDDSPLRARLELARRARDFASESLALPDNRSYRTYVDLGRPYATWNVVAAPELSVEPITWCFPIAGCVTYRGYFNEARARRYAAKLAKRGHDVSVYGVRAYSTLGWFADPVLSSFIDLPPADLAGLIFHELSHQVVYLKGDTTFNESFATAVEQLGLDRWMRAGELSEAELEEQALRRRHDAEFVDLMLAVREELREAYEEAAPDDWKRRRKREVLAELPLRYAEAREGWGDDDRYDEYMASELDNAELASIGSYHELVPAFRAIFNEQDGDWADFYAAASELAAMSDDERVSRLAKLTPATQAEGVAWGEAARP